MFRVVISVLLLLAGPTLPATAALDAEVVAEEVHDGHRLVAHNRGWAPVSVRIEISGENIVTTPTAPFLSVVMPGESVTVATIKPKQAHNAYRFRYVSHFRKGDHTAVHDPDTTYRLPFPDGLRFVIGQAFGGVISTHNDPDSEHAVDFSMPEGTLIQAARAGRVIDVIDHHTGGAKSAFYLDKANLVSVVHDDGTIAHYVHLAPRSALVEVGDAVAEGTLLARSGNTGFSSGPHLHFAVVRTEATADGRLISRSVPLRFHSGEPRVVFAPRQGQIAQARYPDPVIGARADASSSQIAAIVNAVRSMADPLPLANDATAPATHSTTGLDNSLAQRPALIGLLLLLLLLLLLVSRRRRATRASNTMRGRRPR